MPYTKMTKMALVSVTVQDLFSLYSNLCYVKGEPLFSIFFHIADIALNIQKSGTTKPQKTDRYDPLACSALLLAMMKLIQVHAHGHVGQ